MPWIRRFRFLPTTGGIAVFFLGVGVFGAAQTTGAGWLTVLASLIVGTLAVGIIWPMVIIRSATLQLAGPIDVVAGRRFSLTVEIIRPRVGLVLEFPDLASSTIWADPPSTGTVDVVAERRGILRSLTVEITCAAPFDLFAARRSLAVDLPQPIYVAPRPVPMRLPDQSLGGTGGNGTGAGGIGHGDAVRSLREYAPGDPMRTVHWRASARRDDLVVKELEPPERPMLALVIDVSGPHAEQAAGEAAGLVQVARREGLPVTLLTAEISGGVVGAVGSTREAGRRLASAVAGTPPTGPIPEGAKIVRVDGRSGAGS